MIKNSHKYGFGNAIGTVYMFFGCLLVSSSVTACAYLFVTNQAGSLNITSPLSITVVVWFVSSAMKEVVGMMLCP